MLTFIIWQLKGAGIRGGSIYRGTDEAKQAPARRLFQNGTGNVGNLPVCEAQVELSAFSICNRSIDAVIARDKHRIDGSHASAAF